MWVKEKLNINMFTNTSKIILVLFIRELYYLSYINHAPALKNDPLLAALPKPAQFHIVSVFFKYIKNIGYKS